MIDIGKLITKYRVHFYCLSIIKRPGDVVLTPCIVLKSLISTKVYANNKITDTIEQFCPSCIHLWYLKLISSHKTY